MLKAAKAVGLNSDQQASQVLIKQNGPLSLFILASCSGDNAFLNLKQALHLAEEYFFESQEVLTQRLEETLSLLQETLKDNQNIQILLSCAYQEGLSARLLYILCQTDQLVAFLIRDGQQVDLGSMVDNNKLVSGFLQPGDRVILASKNLFEILGEDPFELAKVPIDEVEDEVLAKLSTTQVSPLALIVIDEEIINDSSEEFQPLEESVEQVPPQSESKVLSKIAIPIFFKQILAKTNFRKILIVIAILAFILGGGFLGLRFLRSSPQVVNNQTEEDQNQPKIENNAQNIQPVPEISLWMDLDLIKKDFQANSFSSSLEEVVLLDTNQKVLIKINLNNKSSQILAGEDKLGEAQDASLEGNIYWVFSLDKGVIKIENGQSNVVIKKDDQWGEIIDFRAYGSNVYLLSKNKNQIFKYLPIVNGFTERRDYLTKDTAANFNEALKMMIDGSIYVLKSNREIVKYTQGVEDSFVFSGIDPALSSPKSFFVSEDSENLYLLDEDRLIIFDKTGKFINQYRSDRFKEFLDLVVDETNKKVYLLDGKKIFIINLQ